MSLYLLDSDIITLFAEGQPKVCQRVLDCPADNLTTSIVCVEELLTGWYSLLRQSKKDEQIVRAYRRMTETVGLLSYFRILTFSDQASDQFNAFRSRKIRKGTMDLRIACTALEAGAILVTRNLSDFENIPGLRLEDWA